MAQSDEISAALRRRAYDCYVHHPSVPLQDIATLLGVSRTTFFRMRRQWGWPPREVVADQSRMKTTGEASAEETGEALSLRKAALSLASVTRSQIDALVREQKAGLAVDHDKTAKVLASYARTLATARTLLEQEGSTLDETGPHDEDTRSIHELRDELARHLDRIVAEEEARGGDGLVV